MQINLKVHIGKNSFKNVLSPVITVGTFDGVHKGHQKIITRIKSIANETDGESVLLTFDPHPRKILFSDENSLMLINTLKEKIILLDKLGLDHLIIYPFSIEFSRISPTSYVRDLLVNELNISTLVIGYDHHFGRNREGNFNLLQELSTVYDFNLEEINAQEINEIKISSTKIRTALSIGDIEKANDYSGHNFSICGTVIEGNKLGREIGFPTANIMISDKDKIIPANGVYAVNICTEEIWHKGMMNIGYKPTINKNNTEISQEVHIFNFNKDLYGKEIIIEFKTCIRKEKTFSDLNSLKKQLIKDKQDALQLLK